MAAKVESVTKEVLEALGAFLDDAIPDLRQILYDFPESNRNLQYPSASIFVVGSELQNLHPYVFSQGSVSNSKADVKWVIGQYDWSIQLDLWERTKEERHDLYEKLILAFNQTPPNTGVHLPLENYHNVVCSYTITNYSIEDSEASSQRKEWRATVDIVANCKAVVEKSEFIIEESEVTLETPDEIPVS